MSDPLPIEHWDIDNVNGSAQTVKAAPGAGFRLVVVGWTLTDDTNEQVKLFFDTDTAANRILNFKPGASGGESRHLPQGQGLYGAENVALKITAATGPVYGTVFGYVKIVP